VSALLALLAVLAAIGLGGSSVFGEERARPGPLARLSAREKASLLVVSGLPARRGIGGVIVRRWDRDQPRPPGALVVADQEGGEVRAFPEVPPDVAAAGYSTAGEARTAGEATGRSLRKLGVDLDLAPVLDASGGPLGSRHFEHPASGVAFARGLAAGGTGACVKHFPGLGTARVSTDESPRVKARLTVRELATFRAAIRGGVPCVMVGHAFYPRFGVRRASFSPRAYRLLRRLGFRGVAMTDSVSVFGSDDAVYAARSAVRAGADMVLYTNAPDAERAVRALVPLARSGALDVHVRRVLRLRHELGVAPPVIGR